MTRGLWSSEPGTVAPSSTPGTSMLTSPRSTWKHSGHASATGWWSSLGSSSRTTTSTRTTPRTPSPSAYARSFHSTQGSSRPRCGARGRRRPHRRASARSEGRPDPAQHDAPLLVGVEPLRTPRRPGRALQPGKSVQPGSVAGRPRGGQRRLPSPRAPLVLEDPPALSTGRARRNRLPALARAPHLLPFRAETAEQAAA